MNTQMHHEAMLEMFRALGYFRRALMAGRPLDLEEAKNLWGILEWVEGAALLAVHAGETPQVEEAAP